MNAVIDNLAPPQTPDRGDVHSYFVDASGWQWWLTIDRATRSGVLRGDRLDEPVPIHHATLMPCELLEHVKFWVGFAWLSATHEELDVQFCKLSYPMPETN